jgi:hypothetical protein
MDVTVHIPDDLASRTAEAEGRSVDIKEPVLSLLDAENRTG